MPRARSEEGDLFQRIKKRAAAKEYFKEEEVMDMFVQIASALMHIHSKRILHRDLKTQNIFIAKGNIIKVGPWERRTTACFWLCLA